MRIIDTCGAALAVFCGDDGTDFTMERWREYADGVSPLYAEKALKDCAEYDFNADVLPILLSALGNPKKIAEARASFASATSELAQRLHKITPVDIQVDIILCLGLCNGAGWATRLGERHAILLGVEKIIELDWCDEATMAALIYHEIGHIWHDTIGGLRCDSTDAGDRAVWQLCAEGIAMCFEQLLMGDFEYYHQQQDDWLDWCRRNKNAALGEYRRRVDCGESVQDFFGDWCAYEGHSDVGYFLGCEFVKHLRERYTFEAIARLDAVRLRRELSDYKS